MHRSALLLGSDAVAVRALPYWRFGDHGISGLAERLVLFDPAGAGNHHAVRCVTPQWSAVHSPNLWRTHLFNLGLDPDLTNHKWWSESYLGKVVVELRRALSPSLLLGIRAVHFSHRPPAYKREYRAVFPAPIEFKQGQDAIEFDTRALDAPLTSGDPVLYNLLRSQAQRLLTPLRIERSFLDWVRSFARDELVTASTDQSRIAERLGVNATTLRRRLKEHGYRYADVLDELRRQVVAQWLVESSMSIDDVCRRAGYSRASFYRACKRWFQCSPVAYRQANQKQRHAG